jgi:hypothetical protein
MIGWDSQIFDQEAAHEFHQITAMIGRAYSFEGPYMSRKGLTGYQSGYSQL